MFFKMKGKYKTNIEKIMEKSLQENYIKYSYDYPVRSKYGYRIDFALPELKIIVECDGDVWHPDGNSHDRKRDGYFRSQGWKILRFKGSLIETNIDSCIEKIKEMIKNEKSKS